MLGVRSLKVSTWFAQHAKTVVDVNMGTTHFSLPAFRARRLPCYWPSCFSVTFINSLGNGVARDRVIYSFQRDMPVFYRHFTAKFPTWDDGFTALVRFQFALALCKVPASSPSTLTRAGNPVENAGFLG